MRIVKTVIVFVSVLSFLSCSNDNESTVTPAATPPNNSVVIKYSTDVKSIIDNNCISCHGASPTNGAPMSLTNYTEVKNYAALIINRISRTQGASGIMPLGGTRLPQTSIDLITEWQADGLVE